MPLNFPLDPDAVAAANAVILPKNGGKPLTMDRKDAALRAEWLKIYQGHTAGKAGGALKNGDGSSDPTKVTEECKKKIKRKNIIFIGSEAHYNSFWWKMMFIAPGYTTGKGGGPIRKADFTTVAYVDDEYVYCEKLPLDTLRDNHGCTIVKLKGSNDIISVMNDTPVITEGKCQVQVKLQDVVFFSHGLVSEIAMNYEGSFDVILNRTNLENIRSDVFVEDGRIFSYACRTGNAVAKDSFANDAEANPEASLAKKMAKRFNVKVYAFITRSYYANVLRDEKASDAISETLKSKRSGHESDVIDLSAEHEALPHPGLAETGWGGIWGFGASGGIGEGTNGFALWRKEGAREMPVSHNTPTGLSQKMTEFLP